MGHGSVDPAGFFGDHSTTTEQNHPREVACRLSATCLPHRATQSTVAGAYDAGVRVVLDWLRAPLPDQRSRVEGGTALDSPGSSEPSAVPRTRATPSRDSSVATEPVEPAASYREQPLHLEPVHPLAAALLHRHQAGVLEHAEVSRRRRPGAREAVGDLTRRHLPAPELERQQDVAAL